MMDDKASKQRRRPERPLEEMPANMRDFKKCCRTCKEALEFVEAKKVPKRGPVCKHESVMDDGGKYPGCQERNPNCRCHNELPKIQAFYESEKQLKEFYQKQYEDLLQKFLHETIQKAQMPQNEHHIYQEQLRDQTQQISDIQQELRVKERELDLMNEQLSTLDAYMGNFRFIAGLNQGYLGIDIIPRRGGGLSPGAYAGLLFDQRQDEATRPPMQTYTEAERVNLERLYLVCQNAMKKPPPGPEKRDCYI